MRILMFGAGSPPSPFIARQIDGLRKLGVEVDIFPALRFKTKLGALAFSKGLFFSLPQSAKEAVRRADVMHFQWPSDLITFFPLVGWAKRPAVVSLRGRQINILAYMPGRGAYARSLKKVLPQCAGYHCVSRALQHEAVHFGLVESRSRVIYTGLDLDYFSPPLNRIDGITVICMVGALIWRKGYEYALLTANILRQRGHLFRLLIVGDGDDRSRIQFLIDTLELGDIVTLTGSLDGQGVRNILRESHILLHTGLSEGIPNAVIEAMACALPVVAADAGGLREALTNGVEGWIVPTRSPEHTADALEKLIVDTPLRIRMGEAGRIRARQQFDISQHAQQMLSLYEMARVQQGDG